MTKGFAVTFERWNESALEAGETDDRGFVLENVTLTDAIRSGLEYRDPKDAGIFEPNASKPADVTWLTFYRWNEGTADWFRTGVEEIRKLHFPKNMTAASRRRILRLFK